MTTPEFFADLNEGEEYLSILCTKQIYAKMPAELMKHIVISSVRQKNESFKSNEAHKVLVKALRKAKKDLQDFEYNENNK